VTEANTRIANGPAIHPICAMLHANDNTPDPITPVTMCATAVHTVPVFIHHTTTTSLNTCSFLNQKTCLKSL
jgi:hypothetical protein